MPGSTNGPTDADRQEVTRLAGEVQKNKDATDENVEVSTTLRDETKNYAELAEAEFQLFAVHTDTESGHLLMDATTDLGDVSADADKTDGHFRMSIEI